jgi:Xaa-Pro dipeptidase
MAGALAGPSRLKRNNEMNSEILIKQKKAMVNRGFDALIGVAPESVIYTCGFVIPSLRIQGLQRRLAMTVVTPDDNDCLIVVDMETSTAERRSKWFTEIRTYREFEEEASGILIRTLRGYGLSKSRIGIELDYLPAMDYEVLRTALPEAEFVNAGDLFLELRSVKTQEEIDRLREAGRAADKAHRRVQERARAGMTERQVANIITETLYEEGIEDISVMVVASGERSILPNVGASNRVLEAGDIMRIDILGHIGAYCSDVARTYIVGDPSAAQAAMWQKMVDTLDVLKEEIRPGVSSAHLYGVFAEKFKSLGLDPYKFVGHGLGLSVHEHPWIGKDPRFDRLLEPGMVLCVEPFNLTATEGYQLEDEVIVTEDGYELITDQVDISQLLQIEA